MQLRDYQVTGKKAIYEQFQKGVKSVLFQLPTGGGKTIITSSITHDAVKSKKRVLIMAHRDQLIRQAQEKLHAFCGLWSGIIMASYAPSQFEPVQIASVQTLIRRNMSKIPDLVIIDECHHFQMGNMYGKIITKLREANPNILVLGVTATPIRTNGAGFKNEFETLVQGVSVSELIKFGNLTPPRYYVAPLDLSSVKITAGDYNQKQLSEDFQQKVHVSQIIENWKKLAGDCRTVGFAIDVKHSKRIVEGFNNAGIMAAHLDGNSDDETRKYVLKKFAKGEIQVLFNVGLFDEGYDCLDCETEILTPNGWKSHTELDEISECYSLNLHTNKIEITPVDRKFIRPLRDDEKMVKFKSQHIDIRVSENHRIYVRKDYGKNRIKSHYHEYKASEMVNYDSKQFYLPLSGEMEFPGLDLSDDEIRLLGWILTDGSIENHVVSISQSIKKFHNEIRNLLTKLGLDFREILRSVETSYGHCDYYEFAIPKGTHSGSLKRNGWHYLSEYIDKSIPEIYNQMTRKQFKILWDSMMLGNGSNFKGNKSGSLWMTNKHQADRLTQMAVIRGYACSYAKHITKNNVEVYRIAIRDKQDIHCQPSDPRSTRIKFDNTMPGENVWCVTNRNKTIITKRNGKIAIIGNCPEIEAVILARPTKSLVKYMQMVGRALRPANGKQFALVLDFAGVVAEHDLVELERKWTLEGVEKVNQEKVLMFRDKETKKEYFPHQLPLDMPMERIELVELTKHVQWPLVTKDVEKQVFALRKRQQRDRFKEFWVWYQMAQSVKIKGVDFEEIKRQLMIRASAYCQAYDKDQNYMRWMVREYMEKNIKVA